MRIARRFIYCLFLISLMVVGMSANAINEVTDPDDPPNWGGRAYNSATSPPYTAEPGDLCSLCDSVFAQGAPFSCSSAISALMDTRTSFIGAQPPNKNGASSTQCLIRAKFCIPGTQYYDALTNSCVDQIIEVCQEGETKTSFHFQGETRYFCTPNFDEPEDDPTCDSPVATFNGQTICNDNREECENAGGSHGFVDNQMVCIPDVYEPELPECNAASDPQLSNQSFGCVAPTSPAPEQEGNDGEVIAPTDTDGDGIPDSEDSDIDGDGIPNGSDSDADGDGIDNADDPTPLGTGVDDESEDEQGSVSGGGGCELEPQCTGDPILCAIVYQNWSTRCAETNSLSGGSDCSTPYVCSGDLIQCAILEEAHTTACNAAGTETQAELDALIGGDTVASITGDDIDLESELNSVFSQASPSASCPADDSLTVAGATLSVSFQPFCDLAGYLNPLVILLFSLIGFRVVMGAF